MPKINIDEICEPIEITVGGKTYIVVDVPPDTARKMAKMSEKEDFDETDTSPIVNILTELLGATPEDMAKLGIRKLGVTMKQLFTVINDEVEAKNVPKVEVKKSPK
uniref:Tail assembly chaperone n=1 Tax=viral metagenome TaxID=1070528 RepID=A0A6M3M8M8_9ZZZZ